MSIFKTSNTQKKFCEIFKYQAIKKLKFLLQGADQDAGRRSTATGRGDHRGRAAARPRDRIQSADTNHIDSSSAPSACYPDRRQQVPTFA